MRWIHTLPMRLRSLLQRKRVEAELDEELQVHLAFRIRQEIATGSTPEQARLIALRAMEGIEQRKEECRDTRHMNLLDHLVRDTRYAVRALARNPVFTLAVLGALTLGIGANTALFSVINGVLLRPLPYTDSDRLVSVFDSFQQQGMERGPGCVADFLDWKSRAKSFQTLDAIVFQSFTLTGDGGEAEQIPALSVTSTFFETLGSHPIMGRTFIAGEDQPGRTQTVVISEHMWRQRYAASPTVIGKQIAMNGRPFTIIGVMPESFQFGGDAQAWAIFTLTPPLRRGPFFLRGIGKLKEGVSLARATEEMQALAQQVQSENVKDYTRLRFPVVPLYELAVGDIRPMLFLLAGAVFTIFLISVFNVANLMLARTTSRQREIAIRLSIGASRGQLIRQLMTESMLLSLAGGAAGLVVAYFGVAALRWLKPPSLPRLSEVTLDVNVFAFALAVSLLSGLIFGLGPAISSAGSVFLQGLRDGGRAGSSAGHSRARNLLVVAQVALSVLLLVGAGLFIRSFQRLDGVAPGFNAPPESVLTMVLSPTGPRYRPAVPMAGQPNRPLAAYWDQLLERLRSLPQVDSASVATSMPPNRLAETDGYEIEGKPSAPGFIRPAVPVPVVSHDYLRTLGIPLLQGRWFDDRDRTDSPLVTVISEAMARREFPGENPVGKRLKQGHYAANPYMEIIGVVRDVKFNGMDGADAPVFYRLASQNPSRPMWLLIRSKGVANAQTLIQSVKQEIRNLDPSVPADRISTVANALSQSVELPRFRSLLMTALAATALLLAAVGIYGVVAYFVAQRRQEIGVRTALGATRSDVVQLVLGQGSRLSFIGIAVGLASAFVLARFVEKMLFSVTAYDAFAFISAALILGLVAIFSSVIPALRASRIDPVTALRQD